MRVSTGMIFDLGIASINRQTAALLQLQQQVAEGRRIITPSDDPVAAARALEVTQSKSVVAQFAQNQTNANSALGLEEAQLTSTTDVLARIRELAVQAGNSALSSSDRKAIAFELRSRFDEMVGISNATDGTGQYVFSGFMGSTKPFGGTVEDILAGNEIGYFGDDGQRRLQVSPSRFLEISDSGNDVFKRIRNGNGYFVTGYATANTGTGIIDAGRITDPAAWNATTNKNYSINFSVDTSVNPPVTYYDIVDTTTGNSIITDAAPVPNDFVNMRKYVSGQPILLQGLTTNLGGSVTIEGDPVAGDSFSLAPSSSQSVFATIGKLIGVLENANLGGSGGVAKLGNDIGFALTNLDQATENILRARAAIGSRMGEVESLSSVNEDLSLQYQQTLSQLQDLDYAKAISDLTRKQTDLQAAQQAFVRASQLSLFNYL
jgi:flagellar hook-associated protein 3 FlgL